ncbi:MAG: DUF3783 domain-containing protein [Lachnospiraceae bacterium]|jgi:hypothetical protein|nr:DUF3783 domain-containing protein [Lachnospiraceae bacterium]
MFQTQATALLYNISAEKSRKIKFIFIQLKIHIKTIEKKDYNKPIGVLAGISDIPTVDTPYEGEGFLEEMLVFKGFTEKQLDEVLLRFRSNKIPKVNLKAVLTPSNQTWDSITLYKELKKEHEKMNS